MCVCGYGADPRSCERRKDNLGWCGTQSGVMDEEEESVVSEDEQKEERKGDECCGLVLDK